MKIVKSILLGSALAAMPGLPVLAHPGHGVETTHLHMEQITSSWLVGLNLPLVGSIILMMAALVMAGLALWSSRRARGVVRQAHRVATPQADQVMKRRGRKSS